MKTFLQFIRRTDTSLVYYGLPFSDQYLETILRENLIFPNIFHSMIGSYKPKHVPNEHSGGEMYHGRTLHNPKLSGVGMARTISDAIKIDNIRAPSRYKAVMCFNRASLGQQFEVVNYEHLKDPKLHNEEFVITDRPLLIHPHLTRILVPYKFLEQSRHIHPELKFDRL